MKHLSEQVIGAVEDKMNVDLINMSKVERGNIIIAKESPHHYGPNHEEVVNNKNVKDGYTNRKRILPPGIFPAY